MKVRKGKAQPKEPTNTSQSLAGRVRMTYVRKGFGGTRYPKKS